MAPEFEEAAAATQGLAKFVKVDSTEETDLAKEFKISVYPTIKAFEDGEPVEFKGGRTADTMIDWVKKMTEPHTTTIESRIDLEAFKERAEVVVVAFLPSKGCHEARQWDHYAREHRQRNEFGIVYDSELAKAEGANVPGLIVYKDFDNKKDISESFDINTASAFIRECSFKMFDLLGPNNYRDYMNRGLPIAWLFLDPEDDAASESAKAKLASIAPQYLNRLSFVYVCGQQRKEMAVKFALSGEKYPAFAIDDGEHYAFDESLSVESPELEQFIADYVDGKLLPSIKSEDLPEQATVDGLTTIVGSNFKEVVFDESKTVFVKFYAPWCGFCKKMTPDYEQLAKTYENDRRVVVSKINVLANDVPKEFGVTTFPALFVVKAATNELVEYTGSKNATSMSDFLKEQL
eukprot:TRINITY_DN1889_c0_g4_i1.p1 TRINITY_DN1889_c0_g4~~TRINITY_DN1889_c0_g4_i1.p1  ORF type:complete len:406 (+),score=108.19 TRINITY_DN1889_c0_g4_i1:346-1563(+)